MQPPNTDPWLERHLPAMRAAGKRVLEVGCGPGTDAAHLAREGFTVTAFDRANPGRQARGAAVGWLVADARTLPFRTGSFDVVVASLSLHYLPWAETLRVFREVGELLVPGGIFLFRVNASDDVNHGAGSGAEIEPGFFRMPEGTGGWSETKRFFTEEDVRTVIPGGFAVRLLEHRTTLRYRDPKQVWEVLAAKD
ncbi:MAG TPA: methyltransferase domain-containing protein [Tepidiformaceae bacterium]|nr:methyltransferase domain-containing protein [Tepidiformaceae bacterium]